MIPEEKAIVFDKVEKIYKVSKLFGFKENIAFSELSFTVNGGDIVGLLGLNGAGKTTIMKLIAGLLYANKGDISIFGKSPLLKNTKKDIGFMPELPYFPPDYTPGAILKYYGMLSGINSETLKTDIPKILDLVKLTPHKDKKIKAFSKGMLQRLALAQAILHKPRLLLLDEPVSGLDVLAIRDIREIISSVNKNNTTVFLSSHSISEVEKICNKVFIMSDGKIIKTVIKQEWEAAGGLEDIFVAAVQNK